MERQIHSGHRARLRERAMNEGLEGFNPHQVMELLLFYAIPRQDTSELAHRLIDRFGTVQGILNAAEEDLIQIKGIGHRTAQWLHTLGELTQSYLELKPDDRPRIMNYKMAFEYCRVWGKAYRAPSSFLLCLTPDGAIQSFSHLCDSLEWRDPMVLKRILNDVLSVRARNVIILELVEGLPVIREEDVTDVENFAFTLRAMDVELLDVIRVGEDQVCSMHREGCFSEERFGAAMSALSEYYLREDIDQVDYDEELPLTDSGL